MFYRENLKESTHTHLKVIKEFGVLSGYKGICLQW